MKIMMNTLVWDTCTWKYSGFLKLFSLYSLPVNNLNSYVRDRHCVRSEYNIRPKRTRVHLRGHMISDSCSHVKFSFHAKRAESNLLVESCHLLHSCYVETIISDSKWFEPRSISSSYVVIVQVRVTNNSSFQNYTVLSRGRSQHTS